MFRIGLAIFVAPDRALGLLRFAQGLPDGFRKKLLFKFLVKVSTREV